MNIAKHNHYLDCLKAALRAKEDATKALVALVALHKGKRTLELMESLLGCMQAIYPKTDAELSVRKGEWNVSFPSHGSGYQTWREFILPHLPKLREAANKGKKKQASPVEVLTGQIRQLRKDGMTKSQAFAAVELAFAKRK